MKQRKIISTLLAMSIFSTVMPMVTFAEDATVLGSNTSNSNRLIESITFNEYNDDSSEMYKVVGRNRLEAHTDGVVPYESEDTALVSTKEYKKENSARIKMLTGSTALNQWDFTVVKNLQMGAEKGLINADGTTNAFAAIDYTKTDIWKSNVTMPSSWTSYGEWWNNVNTPNGENETWVWDYPIYDNVKMPWQSGEQPYNSSDEKTASYGTLAPGEAPVKYNPIGFYRTTINSTGLTKNQGDRIVISFQGVESAYYVFIDGVAIGYSEDSFRPHEFDITDYVSDGLDHTLAVRVHKFSDSTWLEDQDMIYDGGIFRDVYMISLPSVSIEDYKVETDFDANFVNADLIVKDLKLRNNTSAEIPAGYSLSAKLYDIENTNTVVNTISFLTTAAIPAGGTLTFDEGKVLVNAPKQWSAEKPNLYVMSLNTKDECTAQLVGFREINFTAHSADYESNTTYDQTTINGKPLLMKGANRHDSDPINGKYVSQELYDIDLKTMKQFNINTIRTSHYANDEYLYYLADTQGFYVMGETNAESHAVAQRDRGTADVYNEKLGEIFKDRTITSYQTLKNHSSIVAWSIGNECGGLSTGNQTIYYWMADYFHENDTTRPIHAEFVQNRERFDMESNMYPSVEKVQSMASTPEKSGSANAKNKPYFICEYDHAMGNAVGDLDGYWSAIRSGTNMLGGCIWDWVDQSRIVPLSRVTSSSNAIQKTDSNKNKVPSPFDYYKDGKYLANENLFSKVRDGYFFGYGGDWGDINYEGRNVAADGTASGSGSGQFCVNGLVSPDRQPQPELYQVKYIYQNFWLKETTTYEQQKLSNGWTTDENLKNQQVVVYNENNFTNLNEFNMSWTLKENGEAIASGNVADVTSVAPKSAGAVSIPYGAALPSELPAGAEYQLYISITQKADKWGTNAGHEVAHEQFDLSNDVIKAVCEKTPAEVAAVQVGGDGVSVSEASDSFSVTGPSFSFSVSKLTGFLSNYVYNGEELIEELKPNYTRANHDNDSPMIDNWRYANEQKNITPLANTIKVSDGTDGRKVIDVGFKLKVNYTVDEYAKGFLRYTIDKSGAVTYRMYLDTTDMPNQTADGRFILRLGTELKMDKNFENITWYGNGYETGTDMEYGYNYPVAESYRDRDSFAALGVYSSNATDMYFPHLKNQETGTVNNVKWAVMDNSATNTALLVSSDKTYKGEETDPNYTDNLLEVSALHYSTKDLRNGAMHPYELVSHSAYTMDSDSTYFNVDHKSLGIGNVSCGPQTRNDARINTGYVFDYEYTFVPTTKSENSEYQLLSASWNAVESTDAAEPAFVTEIGNIGYTTVSGGFPSSVSVDGVQENITWKTDISECDVYEQAQISGTLADGREISGTINVYPDDMYYFVDCNDSDATVFNSVKAISAGLKNTVGDQTSVTDGWGISSTSDAYGNPTNKMTAGDKYKTGYYINKGKTLDYQFSLEAGKYVLTEGAYEFWTGNASRTMKITVKDSQSNELGSTAMVIDSKNGVDYVKGQVSFELENVTDVTVSLSNQSGADPVLSWIGISSALPYSISTPDGITPSTAKAYAGESVTLSGDYAKGSLFVNDATGALVDLVKNDDDTYSFTMPKADVTVTGLVNTADTMYVVPDSVERVRGGSETDNRNYYIKNNCALGMTFTIPTLYDKKITGAKLNFTRQNTAGGQKTNIYDQTASGFSYVNAEGYLAQYNGNTISSLALSQSPDFGAYKLLLTYDSTVSTSAAGNDYYVINPIDIKGNVSSNQIPTDISKLPYITLSLEDYVDTGERTWSGYSDAVFTGTNPDFSIAWKITSNPNDRKGATHTVDTANNLVTITSNDGVSGNGDVLYGVAALVKGLKPNSTYTLSFKEKTNMSAYVNNGVYVNAITQAINWSTVNPDTTKDVTDLKSSKIADLHRALTNDTDWCQRTITYTTGSGLPEGYDTLEARFTFMFRGITGTVQIKDLQVTGMADLTAEQEPDPEPVPVPAPTKNPDKDYTPTVHTGQSIDRLNTSDVFQYHYAGGTDDYNSGASQTGKKYDAYLWVPSNVTPDTLRGLVAIKMNLIEVPLAYSNVLRQTLSQRNFGILFIIDQNDAVPEGESGLNYKNVLQGMYTKKDYKGDDLFTDAKWLTWDGKDASQIMDEIMSGIAEKSGYSAIANNTPIITIGHSAASPFGYRSGNWAYNRVIAQIDMKNGMWGDSTSSSTADNDAHGFGMVPGIPSLQYAAQYTEHAVGAGRDRSVCDARYHIDHQRAVDENQLVSHIIEWGSGHYDWSNNATDMLSKYIDKAIEYRLPDTFTGGSNDYTLNDLTGTGYLMKPFEKDNGVERPAGYYSQNSWLSSGQNNESATKTDKNSSFWFFDKELADEINSFTDYAIPESPGSNDTKVAGKTHTDLEPYMLMKNPSLSVYANTKYDFNSYISPFTSFNGSMSRYGDQRFINYEKMSNPEAGNGDSNPYSAATNTGNIKGYDTLSVDTYYMSTVPTITTTNGEAYDGVGDSASVAANTKAEIVPLIAPYELIDSQIVDIDQMTRDGSKIADSVAAVTRNTLRFHNNRVYYNSGCKYTNESGSKQGAFSMIYSPEVRDLNGNVTQIFKSTGTGMTVPYVDSDKGENQTLVLSEIKDVTIDSAPIDVSYLSSDADLQKYTDVFVNYGPAKAVRSVNPEDGSYTWQIEILKDQIPENAKYPIEVSVVASNLGKWEKVSGATTELTFNILSSEEQSPSVSGVIENNNVVSVSANNINSDANIYVAQYSAGGQLLKVDVVEVNAGGTTATDIAVVGNVKLMLWDKLFTPLCESVWCK